MTNRWNNCKIKEISLYPDISFNELYNLNLEFKNIKAKHEKDEDKLKSRLLYVLPDEYNQVRVSCNVNIAKMEFKDLKKEMCWYWKTELNKKTRKNKDQKRRF